MIKTYKLESCYEREPNAIWRYDVYWFPVSPYPAPIACKTKTFSLKENAIKFLKNVAQKGAPKPFIIKCATFREYFRKSIDVEYVNKKLIL